ncbi:hypothetical protein N8I77_004938 [Diaporthe amygdali]|uniref:Uncharacterized protein n=1 Tax=Phomopsis amygdali TaxID=1214568 RepID=A0AAD9W7J7_PHOAM|nr:hypothetical protein N8I77_004938 [Diaporthe amygdali]
MSKHLQRKHPHQWVKLGKGRKITYYDCNVQGCDGLRGNTLRDVYDDHMSIFHGIDCPRMKRTTNFTYLHRKHKEILQRHIVQEATELNELNDRLQLLERCLAVDPPNEPYKSCHGFDIITTFQTNELFLPRTKTNLALYLQRLRTARHQKGSLYTKPGVMDTRDGVLDDLEKLLD